MDKYELIEVLRAAADGIAGVSKRKESELNLDCFRRIVYNLCKCVVVREEFSFSSPDALSQFDKSDPLKKIYSYVSRFDQTVSVSESGFIGKELLGKVNNLYKQLTNEDPPKED